MSFEAIVYLLCFIASTLCAYLLVAGYLRGRARLLLWSASCFCLLAFNNLLVFVDLVLLPSIDLTMLRSLTSLTAVAVLIYGFIWEID
ncbi:MAG TPA: DUF5985 family protein [Stellaceae bacterium]|jgi:hypothetical protein|nr:DUF5985 family protein [Stellaceae bacterium]